MNATLRRLGKPLLEATLPGIERITGFHTAAGDYLPHRLQMLVGAYEAEELALMRPFLWPGQTIIDAGANVGYTARFFAEATGETGKVFGFEPNPMVFPILQRNVSAYRQVNLFNLGLSSRYESINLFLAGNNHAVASFAPDYPAMHMAYRPEETMQAVYVEVIKGDDFVANCAIERVDVIKMDVEGWELQVLAGFEQTIANSPGVTIFCEFSPSAQKCAGHQPRALLEWLWAHNFFIRYPVQGELHQVSPEMADSFIEEVVARSYVTLFANHRDGDAAQTRDEATAD